MMPEFPSNEWFQALKEAYNQDPTNRRLGSCDAQMGIKVGDKSYIVGFEAFQCTGVREARERELREDADFYLEMDYGEWQEMLSNIKVNGSADNQHTLNSMDLRRGIMRAEDAYRRDLFYRYNQTFQVFIDAAARVDTQFLPQEVSA